MCCRRQFLQRIQGRTAAPGSAAGWDMAPAEDFEKELYRQANTLQDYTKWTTLNPRLTKLMARWRQQQVESNSWDIAQTAWLGRLPSYCYTERTHKKEHTMTPPCPAVTAVPCKLFNIKSLMQGCI